MVDPVTATEMAARAETAAARAVISAMARGQVHNHKIKIRSKPRPIRKPSLSSRCRNNHKFTPRPKRRPRPQPNLKPKRNCIATIRPRLRSRPNQWSKRPVPMARMTAQKAATTNKGQIDEYRIDREHPPVPLFIFPAVTKPDPATGSIGRSISGLALYKIPLSPFAKGEPLEVHSAFLAAFPQSRGIRSAPFRRTPVFRSFFLPCSIHPPFESVRRPQFRAAARRHARFHVTSIGLPRRGFALHAGRLSGWSQS